jgi:hypothetical protein
MEETLKIINQAKNVYAFKLSANKDFVARDTHLTNGGFLLAEGGGRVIDLRNVGSGGTNGGKGIYFLMVANKPVERLKWDNSAHPDWWIQSSTGTVKGRGPGEAALRLMGGGGKAVIIGVNFRCGTWIDSTGKKTWWKQGTQIRHIDECEFHRCKFVGPHELGRQKDPSGAKQFVGLVTYIGCGFHLMPQISVKGSVGKVVFKSCYKIDAMGKPTGKKIPDQTW